jgi:excinuclease ABC subunit C
LRRFKNDWPQPDLIFLDGGKGHLNMGERLLTELGLVIPIVAVAKGPTRKISNFQFLISNQIPMYKIPKEIIDVIHNKNLIKQIMDEAHRFAIGYHKKLRKKSFLGPR